MAKDNNKTKKGCLNVTAELKNSVDRKYGEFCVKYGKILNLEQFTAILLESSLLMTVQQIYAVSEAKS